VTEQGAVLFTDTRQPGTGALSMNECEEELTWTGTYAESIFESRTIDVSALTLSGPLTLFVTTWGCTSNAGLASGAAGVWGTLYGHDLAICGVPSGRAPVVTTKKTASTSGHVSVDYHFPDNVAKRKLILTRPAGTDALGNSYEAVVLHKWEENDPALASNGPFETDVTSLADKLQTPLVAEASYVDLDEGCRAFHNGFGAVACDTCNSFVGDPVSIVDGNMRYVETDPLPPIVEHVLTRTFNSGERDGGFFGAGWTTIFDQTLNRLSTNGGNEFIHFTTSDNQTVAFDGGASAQVWPLDVSVPSTLLYDDNLGGYVYRPAGGRYATLFDPLDGFFVGLRDVVTGREFQVTRQTAIGGVTITGMIVVDSWSGATWTMVVQDNLVRSITASSGLTWTYHYDTNAYLTSVDGPDDNVWRTYTYGTGGITEARDAAGNVIEIHEYDAGGRAISSMGPSDEIANIEYDPASARWQHDDPNHYRRRRHHGGDSVATGWRASAHRATWWLPDMRRAR
jgi:YD repeat-containing protein